MKTQKTLRISTDKNSMGSRMEGKNMLQTFAVTILNTDDTKIVSESKCMEK